VIYTAEDVIRHELVARIVEAYDAAALKAAGIRETRGREGAARDTEE
jgi:phosphate starvation-inducible protein PhoH